MKKLIILVIALALVGGVAMAQVTLSGQVETRIQRELDGGGSYSSMDNRIQINARVDEYNSAVIRLLANVGDAALNQTPAVAADRAHITTNLGAILGSDDAGIGIRWNTGWNEWGYADVAQIDAYEWGGLYIPKPLTTGTKLSFDVMGMANVHAAVALRNEDMVSDAEKAVISLDGGVDVGVGDVVFEVVYTTRGDDDSYFGLNAGLVNGAFVDDLTLGLVTSWTFFLDAQVDDPTEPQFGPDWRYNAVLQAKYAGLVSADLALVGLDGNEAAALGIGVGVTPVDFASLQFGVGIGIDDDVFTETFNSFDASVLFKLGAAEARFGYFWLNEDELGGSIVTAQFARDNTFSGLYARAKLSY